MPLLRLLCRSMCAARWVQVNGKMRGSVEVARDIGEGDALAAARALPSVAKQLEGKEVKKVIFVAGKILNIIAK